jgi:hypothetical protein
LKPISRSDVEKFIRMAEKIFPRRYASWFAKLRSARTSEELIVNAASIADRIAKQRGEEEIAKFLRELVKAMRKPYRESDAETAVT